MSITRAPLRSDQPYTVFANELLNDNLSMEALGLLTFLLSKSPGWNVLPGWLGEHFGCGRDKIYRILGDLITAGYASRQPERDLSGKIVKWHYLVTNEKNQLPENPEVEADPLPENATSGGSAPQKKDLKTKETDSRPVKAKKETPYSEDFESLWKLYPRTKNSPKRDAWNRYRMLNSERQEMVRRAVPLFAAAMRAENRPEDKIKHMVAWIHSGMYETASAPAAAPGAAPEVPFWKRATREQWAKVLEMWRDRERWSDAWGPDPDQSSCRVPADLLAAHNLKYRAHLFRAADLERFENLVSGKPPVDTAQRTMV